MDVTKDRRSITWRFTLPLFNEYVSLTLLFCYGIIVFLGAFPDIRLKHESLLSTLELVFSGLFLIEVIGKWHKQGTKIYLRRSTNFLDFSLVAVAFIFYLVPQLGMGNLLALRVARLFTLVRLFRFVPDSQGLYQGVIRAMRSASIVIAILGLLMFIFALQGTAFFGASLPEHFGDPLKSMYTVFTIFTVEGWFEIPNEAAEAGIASAGFIKAFFIVVLITGGIIGMSLANAIFVDEMVADNNDKLEQQLRELTQLVKQQQKSLEQLTKRM